jgi:hypothetical protein
MERPVMAIGKTLTVYLAADVDKLRKGLKSADDSFTVFGKSLNSMVGPALIGATAAAGAFAVAIGVQGVQAAMEEEAELTKLGTTLNNLGFGAQTEKVNGFLDSLQYSAAVADSELRPAFDRLVRSTGSVEEAQSALQIALDVSVGTGKSLESVSNALGKAYDGNTGALGKLGAGIDATTLKSGDMNAINEQLTATFQGQSEAAANTAAGGMKKLQIATDELIEAFGTGLIGAVGGSAAEIQNAVDRMRALQPAAENVGTAVGEFGQNAVFTADALLEVGDAIGSGNWAAGLKILFATGDAFDQAVKEARALGKEFEYIQYAAYGAAAATRAVFAFGGAETGGTPTAAYNGLNEMNNAIARMRDRMKEAADAAGGSGGGGGGGGGSLTSAIKQMNPQLRKQIDLVKELTTQLGDAEKKLQAAREEMTEWQSKMAANITSGINLGTIQEFDEDGKRTGQSLLDGFNKQIEQAGIFGGYLEKIGSEGGPELRDAVAALGPEAGNKLAAEMIEQGLIPTMQSKLVQVRAMAQRTAERMTPEFLTAGVNSAVQVLTGTQNALAASASMLEEMGRTMGKTIGDAAAQEIVDALRAAGVAQTGAMGTLAGGPIMSTDEAARVAAGGGSFASALSSTSIAQAIERAIFDSNQRLGRTGQAVLQ